MTTLPVVSFTNTDNMTGQDNNVRQRSKIYKHLLRDKITKPLHGN